jgi:hypothetical protein
MGDQPGLEFPMPELHGNPGQAHQTCLVGPVQEGCRAPRQIPAASEEQYGEQIPRPRCIGHKNEPDHDRYHEERERGYVRVAIEAEGKRDRESPYGSDCEPKSK